MSIRKPLYGKGADRANKLRPDKPRGLRGASFGPAGPVVRIDPATMRPMAKPRQAMRDDHSKRTPTRATASTPITLEDIERVERTWLTPPTKER